MIRGTKNEGISSFSKRRHVGGALLYTGNKSQTYEGIVVLASGIKGELRDEFDAHDGALSDLPSNAFNGTFE